jgi:hypothetical protein
MNTSAPLSISAGIQNKKKLNEGENVSMQVLYYNEAIFDLIKKSFFLHLQPVQESFEPLAMCFEH